MTLILQRPFVATEDSGFPYGQSQTTTYVSDPQKDQRSALVRTPRGGWRPPTPYYRLIQLGNYETYEVHARNSYGYGPGYREMAKNSYAGARNASGYYYVAVPDIPFNMEDRAIIKARNKLKNAKINLPQNFGERRQTERLCGDTLKRVAHMIDNMPRLKPGRAIRRSPEEFFNLWLELQYGWKPLLSDVHGAISALHDREQKALPPISTVKAVERVVDKTVTRLTESAGSVTYSFDRVCQIEHKLMVRLDFVEDDNPVVAKTLVQLGITNPLELAWELLPWSFVADWFVPIGSYLSQLDATLGYTYKGGSCSRKSTLKVKPSNASWNSAGQYKFDGYVSVEGSGYGMVFDRKVYDVAPMPVLPNLGKFTKASPDHVANGIALVMSAITGKLRVR